MIKRVKIIGHIESAADLFLGRVREITVNITKNTLRVHDGATLGGFELARKDVSNVPAATAVVDGKMTAAQAGDLSASKASIDAHVGAASGHPNATTSDPGFESAADKTKLDGIETGADVNPSAAEILADLLTVDGSGSGLDADLLKGLAQAVAATINTIMRRDSAGRSKVVDPNVAADIATKGYVDGAGFPAGKNILFFESAAPTGWTKLLTQNNKALRVVSGTGGGDAGATTFTSVFGSGKTAGDHTLVIGETPVHAHGLREFTAGGTAKSFTDKITSTTIPANVTNPPSTQDAGGGGSHNHTLSLDLQYIDLIIASKD